MFLFGAGLSGLRGNAFKVNSIELKLILVPQLSAADEKNDIDPGYHFP